MVAILTTGCDTFDETVPLIADVFRGEVLRTESGKLASCDMRTLYLRNVPDEVGERLERLARREGLSLSAFATRELATVARRADNPGLLAGLPDLGVDADAVLEGLDAGRSSR